MALLDDKGLKYFVGKLKGMFAPKNHTHDDRYYTESEIDGKLSSKANSSHTHTKAQVGLGNVDNTADSAKSVKYATSAGSAGSAGSATNDSKNQAITGYIRGLSVSGQTVTYTRGDGTTGSIKLNDPTSVSQLKDDMNTKANKTDVLSLEEIQASTDLSGKIASASAISELNTAIANSGLKMDLLWTNASPKSAFAGQDVSIDLSNYEFFYIIFHVSTDVNEYVSKLYIKNISLQFCMAMNPQPRYRHTSITSSSISFHNSFLVKGITTESIDNSQMIPYKIYGVR